MILHRPKWPQIKKRHDTCLMQGNDLIVAFGDAEESMNADYLLEPSICTQSV